MRALWWLLGKCCCCLGKRKEKAHLCSSLVWRHDVMQELGTKRDEEGNPGNHEKRKKLPSKRALLFLNQLARSPFFTISRFLILFSHTLAHTWRRIHLSIQLAWLRSIPSALIPSFFAPSFFLPFSLREKKTLLRYDVKSGRDRRRRFTFSVRKQGNGGEEKVVPSIIENEYA